MARNPSTVMVSPTFTFGGKRARHWQATLPDVQMIPDGCSEIVFVGVARRGGRGTTFFAMRDTLTRVPSGVSVREGASTRGRCWSLSKLLEG